MAYTAIGELTFKLFALQLLHKNIDSIEKKLSGGGGLLTIKCKDFNTLQLDIPSAEDCINVANSVEQLSNIGKYFFSLIS